VRQELKSINEGDIYLSYDVGTELGRGSFSIVHSAERRSDKKKVAVKIVEKSQISDRSLSSLQKEVEIMKTLKHQNIVELVEVWDFNSQFFIVLELMLGGELYDHIVGRGAYSEKDATIVLEQLCKAIEFMASHNICHRDLKPQNLLCDPTGLQIKVADFGLSRIFTSDEKLRTKCGTPDYIAPEIILGEPYTSKVDMWSAGVVTYELLCGSPPFDGANIQQLFSAIAYTEVDFPNAEWETISPEAKGFIRKLLAKNAAERMSASEALLHPWLSGNASEKKFADSFKTRFADRLAKKKLLK